MFTPSVGYSRPLSAVNDPSVTKYLVPKNLSKCCNQQVAPFIQYLVHLHRDFRKDKESTMNLANSTMWKKHFVPIVDLCWNK